MFTMTNRHFIHSMLFLEYFQGWLLKSNLSHFCVYLGTNDTAYGSVIEELTVVNLI